MERFLWVCVGGAAGTGARYLLSSWVTRQADSGFPFGTLTVNLLGSFLLGALMFIGTSTEMMSPTVRLAVTTGALGGFTTYSTFSYETMKLLQDGAWGSAALNVSITVGVCLAASFLGVAAARVAFG